MAVIPPLPFCILFLLLLYQGINLACSRLESVNFFGSPQLPLNPLSTTIQVIPTFLLLFFTFKVVKDVSGLEAWCATIRNTNSSTVGLIAEMRGGTYL